MIVPLVAPLEALLFAAGSEGLSTQSIAEILEVPMDTAVELCLALQESYEQRESGLQVVELAGAWQMVTRSDFAPYLQRMATAPSAPGLSQAALEVLAIVAYKQPITRAQVESVRGVQSDRVLQTLLHRQLVCEVGRQDSPGRPILYGTTPFFLQTFGLPSLDHLPPVPVLDEIPEDLSLFHLTPSLPRD
ncbi:SMC-Scp complex subunit ScpB [Alicyclobacillus mengziensis]|uniref:SMC-Scp complex subunit ScpB n=1 Tax=Alicyclobacillus mengziensis TaxID=2931921 RepID=UPI002011A3EF|nr:SMC-Scp complex subunit ScpB [Alicyclobacillus mengziensis]